MCLSNFLTAYPTPDPRATRGHWGGLEIIPAVTGGEAGYTLETRQSIEEPTDRDRNTL